MVSDCRCMVLYKPADGDYIQNIWSKNKYRNEETMQNLIESEKRLSMNIVKRLEYWMINH